MSDSAPKSSTVEKVSPIVKDTASKSFSLGNSDAGWRVPAFSKQGFIDLIKSLAWVVPMTILIWIYAEREQQSFDAEQPLPIDVRIKNPNKIVTLVLPSDPNIIAKLTGPRRRLDQVKEMLTGGENPRGIVIEVDPTLSAGPRELPIANQLTNQYPFRDFGITVSECRPAVLKLMIDDVVEVQAKVMLAPSAKTNLDGPPIFEPATVKVRGARTVVEQIQQRDEHGDMIVYADPTGFGALKTAGSQELSDVPLAPIERTTFSVSKVHASLKIRPSDAKLKIDSMSIFLVTPNGLLDQYEVKYDPFLKDVWLTGPQDKIELLQQPTYSPKPKATLEVTIEDATGQPRTGKLKFDNLPEGVTIAPETNTTREFSVVDRATPD